MLLTRRDWRGAEQLDREGGLIVCSNHFCYFDPLALGHFLNDNGRPVRFMAKVEMFRVPVLGYLIKSAKQIPVYRGTKNAASALRDAEVALANGECIALYPEGTLTHDPDLWPMTGLTGVARLALATGAPVIPVAQWGAQEVVDRSGRIHFPWKRPLMHVWAGDQVDFSDLKGREAEPAALAEGTARVMRTLTLMLAEIRGEEPPAQPWDRKNPYPHEEKR